MLYLDGNVKDLYWNGYAKEAYLGSELVWQRNKKFYIIKDGIMQGDIEVIDNYRDNCKIYGTRNNYYDWRIDTVSAYREEYWNDGRRYIYRITLNEKINFSSFEHCFLYIKYHTSATKTDYWCNVALAQTNPFRSETSDSKYINFRLLAYTSGTFTTSAFTESQFNKSIHISGEQTIIYIRFSYPNGGSAYDQLVSIKDLYLAKN